MWARAWPFELYSSEVHVQLKKENRKRNQEEEGKGNERGPPTSPQAPLPITKAQETKRESKKMGNRQSQPDRTHPPCDQREGKIEQRGDTERQSQELEL